jgi:hypothetical protein
LHADYFISGAGADRALATWIGQLIAAQGRTYILQDEHFDHEDFMAAMDPALTSGARVVALLSEAFLRSKFCLKEATTVIHGDPFNREQRLILLRIEPWAPDGNLRNIPYADLVAERRQTDDAALKLKILRALGFADPALDGLPPAPEGALVAPRLGGFGKTTLARIPAQSRHAKIEWGFLRSLATYEKTVGGEHPWVASALNGLGNLYQAQRCYSEAEPLLLRSLAICEKAMGGGHTDSAATLRELARLYQAQGRYSEAEPLLLRSLAIFEKTVGDDHRQTAATLDVLAMLYQAQGRYSEAEPPLLRSLGSEHPDTSAKLRELARLYQAQGRYSEAEPLLLRSLANYEKTVGGEHFSTSLSLHQKARLALDLGRLDESEAAITRARAIQQRVWEPGIPVTLRQTT